MKKDLNNSKIRVVGIGALNLDLIARYSERDTKITKILLDSAKKESIVSSRGDLMKHFYSAAPYRTVGVCAGGSAFNTVAALKAIDPSLEIRYVSTIGTDEVASIDSGLEGQITEQKTPSIESKTLPWS